MAKHVLCPLGALSAQVLRSTLRYEPRPLAAVIGRALRGPAASVTLPFCFRW